MLQDGWKIFGVTMRSSVLLQFGTSSVGWTSVVLAKYFSYINYRLLRRNQNL